MEKNRKMDRLDKTLFELAEQRKKYCECGHIYTDHAGYGGVCLMCLETKHCRKFKEAEN